MIKSSSSLIEVKESIKRMQNSAVSVTLNLGRNKHVNFSGTLNGVYPALFTVMPFDKAFNGKTSYSYSEFMCGKVKIERLEKTS